MPVATVLHFVGRRVCDRVLAAHLVLQLFEHLVERMLAIYLIDPPARLVAHLAELAFSAPAAEPEWAVGSGVGVVDAVDHRVGFLGRLDRLVPGQAASLVHSVRDHHDHFAPYLALQLLVGSEINRVVQYRTARRTNRRHRSRMDPAHPRRDAQLAQPFGQQPRRAGVILQQLGLFPKADQERQILLPQHVPEELRRRAAFDIDEVALAPADVHQQADGQRQIGFFGEILDRLRLAILQNSEILLLQAGNQRALLVPDAGQNVHQVHIHFNGRQVLRQQDAAKCE